MTKTLYGLLAALAAACALAGPACADTGVFMGGTGYPTPSSNYMTAATNLYMRGNGFDDAARISLTTPEQASDASYLQGEAILTTQIETLWATGQFNPANQIYVWGYSQSAVIAGAIEAHLAQVDRIPTDCLHFVLVGDSASKYGGFFNSFPGYATTFGYPHEAGLVTPGQFYPTDVYTITHDNWADSRSTAFLGVPSTSSSQHLEYLGLTPAEVASGTVTHVDGLTTYHTILDTSVNQLAALYNASQASS